MFVGVFPKKRKEDVSQDSFSFILFSFVLWLQELYEWRCSLRDHKRWTQWRSLELQKDLAYCHPRWPEEQKYIMQELERIQTSRISYFGDWWNIFDWIVYIWISVGVAVRIPALCGYLRASDIHREILALSMIVIWIRLLKVMRAFQALGELKRSNDDLQTVLFKHSIIHSIML